MHLAVAHKFLAVAVEGDGGIEKFVTGALDETAAVHKYAVVSCQPAQHLVGRPTVVAGWGQFLRRAMAVGDTAADMGEYFR